jgi:MacB-like periplasmic core domain
MRQDFVFALRQLKTNFKFSVIVVLTLALGIGATTAIFSVVSGVLLRGLPFPEPERVVSLQTLVYPQMEESSTEPGASNAGSPTANPGYIDVVSFPDFFDWRQQNKSFEAIASYAYGTSRKFTPPGHGASRIIPGEYVSANFFHVLGVTPMLGRDFTLADETDANRPIIISHRFWVTEFHASPDIIGQGITLSDRVATIVGVLPADFTFPGSDDVPFWGAFMQGSMSSANPSGMPQRILSASFRGAMSARRKSSDGCVGESAWHKRGRR